MTLLRLHSAQTPSAGQLLLTESPGGPQILSFLRNMDSSLTKVLHLATISSVGPVQREGTCCNREVYVLSTSTLPGSVRFYSKHSPYRR